MNAEIEIGQELIDRAFYAAKDPTVTLLGGPVPAATALLHRVCGNDEALRQAAK